MTIKGAVVALGLCSFVFITGCEGDVHKDIHGNIHVVVNREDRFVAPAERALEKYGKRALPQIETALHAAHPEARLRLVAVMGRIKQTETVPLLRHLALFDAEPRVRQLCEQRLMVWATGSRDAELAMAAAAALKALQERRAQGLGPLVRSAG